MAALNDDPFDIAYFARNLDRRREEGHQTTLILGSRASALFRSDTFYEIMQQYGNPSFGQKAPVKKFEECYTLLTKKGNFNIREIDSILNLALENMPLSPADLYLAALIVQRFFDVVISTSLDDFLWRALRRLGVHEESVEVYDGYNDSYEDQNRAEKARRLFLLVNAFGQLTTRGYKVQRENYFKERQALKELIWEHTQNDVLCLGYDPVWDAELGKVFHPVGGTLWYINEEELSLFSDDDAQREIVRRVNPDCSYDYFLENLYPR